MAYAKVHQSILQSSLWCEDSDTKVVWFTLLALANKHGEVQASIPGLARTAGVAIDKCSEAIDKFTSPDKYSRTKDADGRRLLEIDGGWALTNYAKYRREASKEDEAEKSAERVRRFRASTDRGGRNDTRESVTAGNGFETPINDNADADADADADAYAHRGDGQDAGDAGGVGVDSREPQPQEGDPKPAGKRKSGKRKSVDDLPPKFVEFWDAYPRKVSKVQAVSAWRGLSLSNEDADTVISDVKARSASADWVKEGGRYIPYPSTYLNNRRWTDDINAAPQLVPADGSEKARLTAEISELRAKMADHMGGPTYFMYHGQPGGVPDSVVDDYKQLKAKMDSLVEKAAALGVNVSGVSR
jgi:hypothetical protein